MIVRVCDIIIKNFYSIVNFAPETWSHPVEIYYAHAQSEGSTHVQQINKKMVGSKRLIKSHPRVNMWTNRSRLSFSNKLFIFCSVSCILFPVVASINQGYRPSFLPATPCHSPAPPTKTLADDFTSKLSLLDCNLRLRIYEHVAGLRRVAVSKKKQVRNLVGFLQGLAIIVFYALSFVVSIIALLVLLVTVCSTNPSSSHSPCTVSMISDMSELKNNAIVMFVVIILMFQSVAFRCATGKHFTPASIRVTKRRIKNLLHKSNISTSFRVYRLRNVVHNMLLLLSGDVELNPGPNGTNSGEDQNSGPADGITGNSYENSTDAGYESFSVPSSAVSLPPPYLSPPLSPLPTPSVATNTNHSATLESVPSTDSTINTLSEAVIPENRLPSHLSASIEPASRCSTSQLNLLSTSQVHLNITPVEADYTMTTGTDSSYQPTQFSHQVSEMTTNEILLIGVGVEREGERERERERETNFVPEHKIKQLKKQLEDHKKECKSDWIPDTGFTPDCSIETKKTFYRIMNKLYRLKNGSNMCPLCMRSCESRHSCRSRDSHIWPRSLLERFGAIHCDGAKNFMYDISCADTLGTGLRCPSMLCNTCEGISSKVEGNLSDVYLSVVGEENIREFGNTVLPFPNRDNWFQFILANILFRGLLIGADLEKEFDADDLWAEFMRLRDYCNKKPNSKAPDMRLFILPPTPLNKEMYDLTYPLETLVREIRFTQVVREETEGTFLYTQFDCFHLVIPLDLRSQVHFDHYRNGFIEEKCSLYVTNRVKYHSEKAKTGEWFFQVPKDDLQYEFPYILLGINARRYPHYIPMVTADARRKKPKLSDSTKVIIERAPDHKPSYPHKPSGNHSPTSTKSGTTGQPNVVPINLQKSKEEIKKLIKKASEVSPLRVLERKERDHERKKSGLEKYLQTEEQQRRESNEENASLKKQVKEMDAKMKQLRFVLNCELRHGMDRRVRHPEEEKSLVNSTIKKVCDSELEPHQADRLIERAEKALCSPPSTPTTILDRQVSSLSANIIASPSQNQLKARKFSSLSQLDKPCDQYM